MFSTCDLWVCQIKKVRSIFTHIKPRVPESHCGKNYIPNFRTVLLWKLRFSAQRSARPQVKHTVTLVSLIQVAQEKLKINIRRLVYIYIIVRLRLSPIVHDSKVLYWCVYCIMLFKLSFMWVYIYICPFLIYMYPGQHFTVLQYMQMGRLFLLSVRDLAKITAQDTADLLANTRKYN